MKTQDKLGEEIREVREKLSLNQKELAREMNITPTYLSYLEQGKKIPSKEFLENLYKKINLDSVPSRILNILSESKIELKKKKLTSFTANNYIYLMQERGLYNQRSLKKLIENNPQNLHNIHAMMVLLLRQKKYAEAEQFLLDSLKVIETPEDKKWLQAVYNKLNGEYELSIQLMLMALEQFEKNNPVINNGLLKKKAHFLFQAACMYFDYGQNIYYDKKDYEASSKNFETAIEYHKRIKEIDNNPSYQMDYASIHFWLALLGKSPKENWGRYIQEAKEALKLNYHEGINNFPSRNWNSVYSKPYIVTTVSFIGRSYGEIALLEKDTVKKLENLNEGENCFIQSVPVPLNVNTIEYYRFYFNMACFYSIKAEVLSSLNRNYTFDLDMCYKSLLEAQRADSSSAFKLMQGELEAREGLTFFKTERKKELNLLLSSSKKRSKQ